MKPIAVRALISESATLEIAARARQLAASCPEPRVISLSVGEPDYLPPPVVARESCRAIEKAGGRLTYTAAHGTPELRRAVARKVKERTGLDYDPNREVLITVGGKHAIAGALLALANPGNRVLIPRPYWLSYPAMAVIAGAESVLIDCLATGFKLTESALKAHADPRNAVLIVNSPANPTGAVYSRPEIEAVAREAAAQDLWVISDEIYDRLLYDGAEHFCVPALPGMRERTLLVNGVSKTYSMTGWRIGYALGPEPVIRAMKTLQSHMTSNPCAAAQQAALAALSLDEGELAAHLAGPMDDLRRRRRLALDLLAEIPGIRAAPPAGAFYIMVDLTGFRGRPLGREERPVSGDEELAWRLLEEEHVAVAAGTPFGAPWFVRLSFAVPDADLLEGIQRLKRFLKANPS